MYKKGKKNKAAHALSKKEKEQVKFNVISTISPKWITEVKASSKGLETQEIIKGI